MNPFSICKKIFTLSQWPFRSMSIWPYCVNRKAKNSTSKTDDSFVFKFHTGTECDPKKKIEKSTRKKLMMIDCHNYNHSFIVNEKQQANCHHEYIYGYENGLID